MRGSVAKALVGSGHVALLTRACGPVSVLPSTSAEKPLEELNVRVTNGHTIEQVAADVRTLHRLAVRMRRRRFDQGVVSVQKPRLSFILGATS